MSTLPQSTNQNLPTKTWKNPRWATTPEWARPIIQSLEQFLARPKFYNGVELGDGVPPTKDPDTGVTTPPDLTQFQKDTIAAIDSSLTSLGTSLNDVYADLATMQSDLDALATDPIDGTRITDGSISTPKLAANSVTATKLAAMNIGVGKWIASTSYSAGSSGWIIAADGTAEFNNVTVRGQVLGSTFLTANSGGRIKLGTSPIVGPGGMTMYGMEMYTGNESGAEGRGVVGITSTGSGTSEQGILVLGPSGSAGSYSTPAVPLMNMYARSASGLSSYIIFSADAYDFQVGDVHFDNAISVDTQAQVGSLRVGAGAATISSSGAISGANVQVSGVVSGNNLSIGGGNATISSGGTLSCLGVSVFGDISGNIVTGSITFSSKAVSQGATDSGGAGYRVLRVPN